MKKIVPILTGLAGVAAIATQWMARYTFAFDISKGSNNKAIGTENAPRINASLTHGRWAATAAGLAALYAAWRLWK